VRLSYVNERKEVALPCRFYLALANIQKGKIAHSAQQFIFLRNGKTSAVCHAPALPGGQWEVSSVTVTRLAELLNFPCVIVGIVILQSQT